MTSDDLELSEPFAELQKKHKNNKKKNIGLGKVTLIHF